jgi:polyisoprenoid-binding protein YceI
MANEKWEIDTAHTSIGFSVRHMVITKVHGRFNTWKATADIDLDDITKSSVEVSIEAASIDTNEAARDQHLRSPDFLDVEKYPSLRFQSERVERKNTNQFRIVGNLEIHGVTKPVTLEAELLGRGKDPWGAEKVGFSVEGKINRKDWGLTWNQALEAGGVLVSEAVEIHVEAQAKRVS